MSNEIDQLTAVEGLDTAVHEEAADLVLLRKLQAKISLELLKSFKKLLLFSYLFYVKIILEGIS